MAQAQVFPCPNCKESIATDAERCRICQTPVDQGIAQIASAAQAKENKQYRRAHCRKHLLIGAGLFLLGLVGEQFSK